MRRTALTLPCFFFFVLDVDGRAEAADRRVRNKRRGEDFRILHAGRNLDVLRPLIIEFQSPPVKLTVRRCESGRSVRSSLSRREACRSAGVGPGFRQQFRTGAKIGAHNAILCSSNCTSIIGAKALDLRIWAPGRSDDLRIERGRHKLHEAGLFQIIVELAAVEVDHQAARMARHLLGRNQRCRGRRIGQSLRPVCAGRGHRSSNRCDSEVERIAGSTGALGTKRR